MTKSPLRRRIALGATVGALGIASVAGIAISANAADPTPAPAAVAAKADDTVANTSLDIDASLKAAQAALDAAEKDGQRVTVVVMDRAGNVQVQLKGDGAGPQTEESAKRKAFTAVSFGRPTADLADAARGDGATVRDIPGTLFLGGGVPITADGMAIGAIGVGGAPSADLDNQYANAGVAALR